LEKVRLGSRDVGPAEAPYVIAEIGSNHNGDMDLCEELIFAAAEAGADAAKFQSWSEESLISEAEYERNTAYTDTERHFGSLREMVRRYQLTRRQHEQAIEMCSRAGIDFLSSAFSVDEVAMLAELGVPAVKIASMDINHTVLLEAAADSGLTVVLSTGMATMAEIASAVDAVASKTPLILLHCISLYPADPEFLNLRNISTFKNAFGPMVGYSDHSIGIAAAIAAVTLGAIVIEKHFTVDRDLSGWDHWMSADPTEMKSLCSGVKYAHAALGGTQRVVSPDELQKRQSFRRCLVLARGVPRGQKIVLEDLAFKRPGTGIPPNQYSWVIGRQPARDLFEGEQLAWSDLV
jgi:N-acetylneuraminate synthase